VGHRKYSSWIEEFQANTGHSPRVLHIGNIANNAYLNAKYLRKAGLDCDVISNDYYHIMASPEWEDAVAEGEIPDHYHPDWGGLKLNGFKRPRWFIQAPLYHCERYIAAWKEGRRCATAFWWRVMDIYRLLQTGTSRAKVCRLLLCSLFFVLKLVSRPVLGFEYASRISRNVTSASWRFFQKCPLRPPCKPVNKACRLVALIAGVLTWLLLLPFAWALTVLGLLCFFLSLPVTRKVRESVTIVSELLSPVFCRPIDTEEVEWFNSRVGAVIQEFDRRFPARPDRLTADDFQPYLYTIPTWRRILAHYDLIVAYGIEPIVPLLVGKTPYFGFEHGTLRTFTLGDSGVCRLTALAYSLADGSFVTNGDCLEYAEAIKARKIIPALHPIDQDKADQTVGQYAKLHSDLGARHLFLCTLRHDWEIKGTDKYIRALPLLRKKIGDDFRMIMTPWGEQVEESRELARSLGVEQLIHWDGPYSRPVLYSMLKSVDVLCDQTALPCFGATAPEGLANGVPVIMSYDPKSTEWIMEEPAPILVATTPEEIADKLAYAVIPGHREDLARQGQQWFRRNHSPERVVQEHMDAYTQALSACGQQESS
jgi:glycosyltransferase involved in cell wall biosynthesis